MVECDIITRKSISQIALIVHLSEESGNRFCREKERGDMVDKRLE